MESIGFRFLMKCKENYFNGITPSNPVFFGDPEYNHLIEIGKEYLAHDQMRELTHFFLESQYFVPLWAAHIILQFGTPDSKLKDECLTIIREYANHPLNQKIAKEETEWLSQNVKTV